MILHHHFLALSECRDKNLREAIGAFTVPGVKIVFEDLVQQSALDPVCARFRAGKPGEASRTFILASEQIQQVHAIVPGDMFENRIALVAGKRAIIDRYKETLETNRKNFAVRVLGFLFGPSD